MLFLPFLPPPTTSFEYEPMRVLGEGAFGKVYLMRQRAPELVCIKVIKVKNMPKKEREACKMEVDLLGGSTTPTSSATTSPSCTEPRVALHRHAVLRRRRPLRTD